MIVQRENMYFEPRVINTYGGIRWYGATYSDDNTIHHCEETVYVRDDGDFIYIYHMVSDNLLEEQTVDAIFCLISKIRKHEGKYKYCYGKRI